MTIGVVRAVNIDDQMRESYLDYAMSVIVARALPDARDGLKPVQRRILHVMYDMGLRPDSPYKKSARIVGEVLGKYHPHGDQSIYDAMARMAQDFSVRYALVDGQGNFGSIDGDAPAAMRYTEARTTALGIDLLTDIDKDTVNFSDNFDGSLQEPTVLPAAIPNLLVNGSSGIAVGMSTNIPPHNLGEVCDALVYMLRRWEALDDVTVGDLMQYVKGPDFPTGGLLYSEHEEADPETENAITAAYATGRGKLILRAKAHIEALGRGRNQIVISEIPYQINKNSLIERIADLVRNERIDGISDLRDESDRQGLRIVIEIKLNADPADVLRDLFKYTPLQTTFGVIMLALVDNEPRTLTLKQALRVYLEHRQEVVRRRSEYDLNRARERAHILQGLLIALENLNRVIKTIRESESGHRHPRYAVAPSCRLRANENSARVPRKARDHRLLRGLAGQRRRHSPSDSPRTDRGKKTLQRPPSHPHCERSRW
jgi:DNA gyrase subunit A